MSDKNDDYILDVVTLGLMIVAAVMLGTMYVVVLNA